MAQEEQAQNYSLDSVLESIGKIDDARKLKLEASICRKLNITPVDEITVNRAWAHKMQLQAFGSSKLDDVPDEVKNSQKYGSVVLFLQRLKDAQSTDNQDERLHHTVSACGLLKNLGLSFQDVFPSVDPNLEEQIEFLLIQARLNGVIDYTTTTPAGFLKKQTAQSPSWRISVAEDPIGTPSNVLEDSGPYCRGTERGKFIDAHPELRELYLQAAKSYLVRELKKMLAKHALFHSEDSPSVSSIPLTGHDQTGIGSDVTSLVRKCKHFGVDASSVFDGLEPENYFRLREHHGDFLPESEDIMKGYFDILRSSNIDDFLMTEGQLKAYLEEKGLFRLYLNLQPAQTLDWNEIVKVEDWKQDADGSWH